MISVVPSLTDPVVPAGRMRAHPQPTLSGDDLMLRPWHLEDAPAVFDAYQNSAIQQWYVRSMTDHAEDAVWIASRSTQWREETGADWAVFDGAALVGRVGIKRLELWDGIGELAYWVMPAARGHNIAARATIALTQWAFDVLGLHRLELLHATDNHPFCRAAVKAGFHAEGTMQQQGLHRDGWHDMHLHARLAD